jgi:hypothetical protein
LTLGLGRAGKRRAKPALDRRVKWGEDVQITTRRHWLIL